MQCNWRNQRKINRNSNKPRKMRDRQRWEIIIKTNFDLLSDRLLATSFECSIPLVLASSVRPISGPIHTQLSPTSFFYWVIVVFCWPDEIQSKRASHLFSFLRLIFVLAFCMFPFVSTQKEKNGHRNQHRITIFYFSLNKISTKQFLLVIFDCSEWLCELVRLHGFVGIDI